MKFDEILLMTEPAMFGRYFDPDSRADVRLEPCYAPPQSKPCRRYLRLGPQLAARVANLLESVQIKISLS